MIAAQPGLAARLTSLRDNHRAHATALARLLILPSAGPTPPPSADVPAEGNAVFAALLAAEKTAAKEAADAALTAPGWIAGLIGSIAACRATHVEVLS